MHGIWKITFYTPEPTAMVLKEAEQAGYSAQTTATRLVVRGPYNTAETYSEDVSSDPSASVKSPCASTNALTPLGGWSPHGSPQGECLPQGTTWSECCQLGSSLPNRWVNYSYFILLQLNTLI